MRSSIMDISSIYGREEEVSLQDRLQFIFILRKELISNEDFRMITMMYYSKHELKRYGFKAEDYFIIKNKIQEASIKRGRIVRFVLVTDPQNCEEIIRISHSKGYGLQNLERIFVYSKIKDHKRYNFDDQKNVVVKCVPIRSYINGAIEVLKDCKQSPHLFRSMIFLGDKQQERLSYLLKVWVKAWLSMKPSQYEEYLEKYKNYKGQFCLQYNVINSEFRDKQAQQIQQILQLMRKKSDKQYSSKALKLYQHQKMYFYKSLNIGLKKYIQDIGYSESIALPFHILFHSIKNKFHDLFQQKQPKKQINERSHQNGIQKLFGNQEYIELWRCAKISDEQIRKIKKMEKEGTGAYIQFMNFTSTSKKKQAAVKFFQPANIVGDCLLKITLKKPQLKKELQKFPFIYLSFAQTQEISQQNKEYQILLNALTVAKITKISQNTYSEHGIKHDKSKDNQKLYLIEMQIGGFYELLKDYSNNPKDTKFTQSQRAILQNYLITLEALNEKQYDIGRAYELSGHQPKAYDFYKKKLKNLKQKQKKNAQIRQQQNLFLPKKPDEKKQSEKISQQNEKRSAQNPKAKQQPAVKKLQTENSIVQIDEKVIEDIRMLEDIDDVKQYQFLHNKIALLGSKIGQQKEAIEYSAISMKLYDIIGKIDKTHSIKEHQQMKNKLVHQYVQLLGHNGLYSYANQFINKRMQQLYESSKKSIQNQLLYRFIIAELNIIKGKMQISKGQYQAAKKNFNKSKENIDYIKENIKYDRLQDETFYFKFLIELIIFQSVNLKQKDKYFTEQRAKKIEQATAIFGGKIRFEDVVSNSKQLLKRIQQLDQRQKKKSEESQQKYDFFDSIEQSPVGESIKQHQDSFKIFQNEIYRKGNQFDGADGQDELFFMGKIHLLLLEPLNHENIGSIEAQIDQLKTKFIEKRLRNWKHQRQHQPPLIVFILEIKRMIIQMKDVQRQMKIDKGAILQEYQIQISIKKNIEEYLLDSKKWGYTQPLMSEVKQELKLIQIIIELGNKELAIKKWKDLFQFIRKIDNFRLQTLEGYILNISVNFQGAEMDYLNIFFPKRSTQKVKSEIISKSARQLKNQKLKDCMKTIAQALRFVKKITKQYDSKQMEQQNIQVQASSRDAIRKSLNQIQNEVKKQNREMNRNIEILRSNKVAQSKYGIQVMSVRCKIQLKLEIKQIQLSLGKIQKIRHVTQNQIHLSTIRLQALGLLEYYKKQQKKSFDLLNQCFNKMKGNHLIDRKRKAILLTKIFFLLPKYTQQNDNPLKMDLQIYQSQLVPYHFYWRILLAQYVSKMSNRRGQGHQYIEKCKDLIENQSTEDDESKIRKNLIVSEFEASKEKQKLTASAILFSRKYSMIKPPQKLHLSLKQADKISSQKQQQYQNQKVKIAQQKMPVQNPAQFYQKPQVQSLKNIKICQQNNFSEELRQNSIKSSDNLNNEQADFQEVQFPFPNISQQLPANPQQNRQEGLSKKYRSDELKREDDKNNNISGIFSKLKQSNRMIMNRRSKSLMRSSSNNSSQSNYSSPQKSTNQNTSPNSRVSKSPIMIQYLLQSKRRLSPAKYFMNKKKEIDIILASNSFESTKSLKSMEKLIRQNRREQMKDKQLESNKRYAKQKKLINQSPQIFSNALQHEEKWKNFNRKFDFHL